MTPPDLHRLLDAALAQRIGANQLRVRRIIESIDAAHARVDGKNFINFCSNDYLGLAHHPRIVEAFRSAAAAGSGSAGLICGYSPAHALAESALAQWKKTESAVLLPSGYQANHAAVQTFSALSPFPRVRFLVDKLAHASLLDAVRGSERPWRIFPHNNLTRLARLLEEAPSEQLQVVVTESIFSMDGDAADLRALGEMREKYRFALLLDEAHGTGIYGDEGAGLAAELGLWQIADVSIVTLSKAAGVVGGAICCSEKFRDAVLNFGRAYIFSTSIPSPVAAAIEASIHVMREEPNRRMRVRELARRVRGELIKNKIAIPPGDSPIVPILLGDESAAMERAKQMLELGLLIQPVRPPAVPRGTSRLRITLSSQHADGEIEQLIRAVVS